MKLKLNREYALRHLGVALLMLGLSGWFAYDGYVSYPQRDDGWFEAQHLKKDSAIRRQKEFAVLSLFASLVIAAGVWRAFRFRFAFDDVSYTYRGKTVAFAEIKSVDRSRWQKKGILKVDGIVLDSWHHLGVEELSARIQHIVTASAD